MSRYENILNILPEVVLCYHILPLLSIYDLGSLYDTGLPRLQRCCESVLRQKRASRHLRRRWSLDRSIGEVERLILRNVHLSKVRVMYYATGLLLLMRWYDVVVEKRTTGKVRCTIDAVAMNGDTKSFRLGLQTSKMLRTLMSNHTCTRLLIDSRLDTLLVGGNVINLRQGVMVQQLPGMIPAHTDMAYRRPRQLYGPTDNHFFVQVDSDHITVCKRIGQAEAKICCREKTLHPGDMIHDWEITLHGRLSFVAEKNRHGGFNADELYICIRHTLHNNGRLANIPLSSISNSVVDWSEYLDEATHGKLYTRRVLLFRDADSGAEGHLLMRLDLLGDKLVNTQSILIDVDAIRVLHRWSPPALTCMVERASQRYTYCIDMVLYFQCSYTTNAKAFSGPKIPGRGLHRRQSVPGGAPPQHPALSRVCRQNLLQIFLGQKGKGAPARDAKHVAAGSRSSPCRSGAGTGRI